MDFFPCLYFFAIIRNYFKLGEEEEESNGSKQLDITPPSIKRTRIRVYTYIYSGACCSGGRVRQCAKADRRSNDLHERGEEEEEEEEEKEEEEEEEKERNKLLS